MSESDLLRKVDSLHYGPTRLRIVTKCGSHIRAIVLSWKISSKASPKSVYCSLAP